MRHADHPLPDDVRETLGAIDALCAHPLPAARALLDPARPLFVGRAPGRLDVMGGIADYSGSRVLQMPIAEAAVVVAQTVPEREIVVLSDGEDRPGERALFRAEMSAFERDGRAAPLEDAAALFDARPHARWAAYVAGVVPALMRERGVVFERGLHVLVRSAVPEGKGVSSSAAIEVATLRAIAAACDLEIDPRETALLCQRVENAVARAPCGVMDQMTASCGEADALLSLLCQPAELEPPLALPPSLALWGIDSGVRHAIGGGDYGTVRAASFVGYRLLLELAGVAGSEVAAGDIVDDRWDGYLANVDPEEFERRFRPGLPETLSGREFLERFDGTTDRATRIDPDTSYPVARAAAHPVHERARVDAFAREISRGRSIDGPRAAGRTAADATTARGSGANAATPRAKVPAETAARAAAPAAPAAPAALGELMYRSHRAYSLLGLGSEATDRLVAAARRAGPERGIFGAKITGGGSGGTVALLTAADAGDVVREIAQAHAEESGHGGQVFAGSSDGGRAWRLD